MAFGYALVCLLMAHIIADFAVRREILRRHEKAPVRPEWPHLAVFAVTAFALMLWTSPWEWGFAGTAFFVVALASALHLLVDRFFERRGLWKPDPGPRQRSLYVLSQVTKLLVLVILACAVDRSSPHPVTAFSPWNPLAPAPQARLLGYPFGYLFAIFVGDAFVSFILTRINSVPAADGAVPDGAGRLIGILEAILVTTFVIGYQYSAVGLVLAAKSVARFEWLKEQGRAEYFLIGTLANLTTSVTGGLLALWIAGAPIFSK